MPYPSHDLFRALNKWLALNYPERGAVELSVKLDNGKKVKLPVDLPKKAEESDDLPFVPNAFQTAILEALDGKALRTDPLGAAVGDRGRLFKKPGGIQELKDNGLVDNHPRVGYYRPDSPPPDLEA